MMYFYRLGYNDWEESPYTILAHTNQFSKQEFDEMVLQSYVVADDKMRQSHKEWYNDWLEQKIQQDEEIDTEYVDDMAYKPAIHNLYQEMIENMKLQFGFSDLSISQDFITWNSYDILNDDLQGDEGLILIKTRLQVVEQRNRKIDKLIN